jgi:HK97 family phage prohead protease
MKTKFFFAGVKSIDIENRELEAVASTGEMDRDGEVILPSAFIASIESFKANPVILACHQHRLASGSSPVIGSGIPESIKIERDNDVSLHIRFATTALGEEYWQLYRDKHMRAFSIGFIPLKSENRPDQKSGKSVLTYTEIELLEISAVPVPSNRRALARARGFFEDDTDIKSIIEESVKEITSAQNQELKTFIEQQFEDIKSLLIHDSEGFAKELLLNSSNEPSSAVNKDKSEQKAIRAVEKAIGKLT